MSVFRSIPSIPALAVLAIGALGALPAHGELFVSDAKRFGNDRMDIVVREIERRPRASALAIEMTKVGSSVGSSFFILCSVRELARQRGASPYVVKIEEHRNKPYDMIVGFLASPDEDPAGLGPEFAALPARPTVIDLGRFARICDRMP